MGADAVVSIKIFRCMMVVIITAGIFLTACGSRHEEEAEREMQPEVQIQTQPETPPEIQVESQQVVQIELQPEPESENDSDSWAQAYISVIDELREDWELDEIDFSLIYINDDDIPELVFGPEGYWVSVYTWQDEQTFPLMDKWAYGNWGRVYAYVPFQGIIGTVCYSFDDTDYGHWYGDYWDFYQMTETCELEYAYGISRIYDYVGDTYENETVNYYYEEEDMTEPREITEEEFNAYGVVGEREFYCEDAEKYILLIGHSSADEIINELMQTGQQLSNDEEEEETSLSDITWEDYNSGNEWKAWIHFSFNDGTVIDKELPYSPSIVEKADFVDITGDGTDEVLIYRYFANTATEYTLVNFFQIEENSVTEISPELELEELADNVWSVVDADFSEKEYDIPVFTMESYVKENMVAYADKRLLVGYQDGGWKILERQVNTYYSHEITNEE